MSKTLSYALFSRKNNTPILRHVAALTVFITHVLLLTTGEDIAWPFGTLGTDINLGRIAVLVFFAISGVLIAHSFVRRPSIWMFVQARTARIVPALFVAVVLTVFVFGPIVTTLSLFEYFTSWQTYKYVFFNTVFFPLGQLSYTLPGVFEGNVYPRNVNGSLWTLPVEVWCYTGVLFLGIIGALHKRILGTVIVFFLVIFSLSLAFFTDELFVSTDDPWLLWRTRGIFSATAAFGLGILAFLWANFYRLRWWDVAFLWAVIFLLPFSTLWFSIAIIFAVALTTHYIGFFATVPSFLRADYSYGIYIYGFPITQVVVHYFPNSSVWIVGFFAFALTFLCAFFSWHVVEKPFLVSRQKVT